METFDLLVVFKDGSEVVIEGVWDYEIKKDILSVKNGGYASLFNWSEVKYCGRLSDLR